MLSTRVGDTFLWALSDIYPIEKRQCYSNSGVATILSECENDFSRAMGDIKRIRYALGFLLADRGERVPHAWLICDLEHRSFFCDPTLQVHSREWRERNGSFVYELKHVLHADELSSWLRSRYSNRTFNEHGIPQGHMRFPILSLEGHVD